MAEMNEAEARVRAAKRRKHMKRAAIGTGVFLFILAVVYGIVSYQKSAEAPGETYADIGNQHIALSAELPVSYNSNPPSSGAHYQTAANWGVYGYEVNDRIFIHNLEHGGIWISYRPTISDEAVQELKDIVAEYNGSKLVMAPRSASDADVAVAAWAHVLKLNIEGGMLSNEQKNQIHAFYKAYKNRGPEFVPDAMPGIDPKTLQ